MILEKPMNSRRSGIMLIHEQDTVAGAHVAAAEFTYDREIFQSYPHGQLRLRMSKEDSDCGVYHVIVVAYGELDSPEAVGLSVAAQSTIHIEAEIDGAANKLTVFDLGESESLLVGYLCPVCGGSGKDQGNAPVSCGGLGYAPIGLWTEDRTNPYREVRGWPRYVGTYKELAEWAKRMSAEKSLGERLQQR
jgi:hypothetical protein